MDKTITAVGTVLVSLGIGFWTAFQVMPELHSAYLTGGYMWMVLGAITVVVGLKKQERIGTKKSPSSFAYQKSAIGV